MLLLRLLKTFVPALMIGLAFAIPSFSKNSSAAKWFVYPLATIALMAFLFNLKKIWTDSYDK